MNIYGLIIMSLIMLPNIIFAFKEKNFESKYHNKIIETIEQIGRFGSMGLMIFNIPLLEFSYWFSNGRIIYMVVVGVLAALYCFTWFLYFRKSSKEKAMLLAIIPTVIFLFSGIMQGKILLIITAILFGIGHIIITYKNR